MLEQVGSIESLGDHKGYVTESILSGKAMDIGTWKMVLGEVYI